jgi:hypothetical protein
MLQQCTLLYHYHTHQPCTHCSTPYAQPTAQRKPTRCFTLAAAAMHALHAMHSASAAPLTSSMCVPRSSASNSSMASRCAVQGFGAQAGQTLVKAS